MHLHHPSGLPGVVRFPSGAGGAFTGALLHGRDAGEGFSELSQIPISDFFYKLQQLRYDVHQIPILLIRKLII
jgi:hypothetical protein